MLSAIALFFVLNIERFIYPAILPLNPNNPSVISFSVSQKFYAVVDNIEETEKDGETTYTVTLVPMPDEDRAYEDKTIMIEYNELDWSNLPLIISYWDKDKPDWVYHNEKPTSIEAGIEISDSVVVFTDTFYNNMDTGNIDKLTSFSRIVSVHKNTNEKVD
ncbi:hypothetical protein JW796_04460 [Candidatus Dojkabacteria bacterium]|nr:hypothetical protein [Candidatus Dojkabacteria bacterium]